MKKLNKIALALGTVATVAAPVAAVVSCGSSKTTKKAKVTPTATTKSNAPKPGSTGSTVTATATTGKTDGGTGTTTTTPNTGAADLKAAVEQAKADAGYDKMSDEDKKTFDAKVAKETLTDLEKEHKAAPFAATDYSKTKAILISPAVQYASVYSKYKASLESYTSNFSNILKFVTKAQDEIKKVRALKTGQTPLQIFEETIFGDAATGALLDVTLTNAKTAFAVKAKELKKVADADVSTQDKADAEILKVKQATFDLRTASNDAFRALMKDGSAYLKVLTGDVITKALDTLIDNVDLSIAIDDLSNLISGLIPAKGQMAMLSKGLNFVVSKAKDALKGSDATELKTFRDNLHTIVDVVDFQKIIDKLVFYTTNPKTASEAFMLPLMTKPDGSSNLMGAMTPISDIEGLLIGDVETTNQKNYLGKSVPSNAGQGVAFVFLAFQNAAQPFFYDGNREAFTDGVTRLEKAFPAVKELAPSIRTFSDTVFVMLFEGMQKTGEAAILPAGMDSFDLNLVPKKVPAFIKLIHNQLDSFLKDFDFTTYLSKTTAKIAYSYITEHAEDDGIIGKVLSPINNWLGKDEDKAQDKLGSLFTNLGSYLNNFKTKILEISDKILNGDGKTGNYVKVTDDKTFYANLRQGLFDLLSINLKSLDTKAFDSLKEIFPGLIDGSILSNLMQLLANYMVANPSMADMVKDMFIGVNFNVKVNDPDALLGKANPLKGNAYDDIRARYSTMTEAQVSWIVDHKTNWDLISGSAYGEVHEVNGKILTALEYAALLEKDSNPKNDKLVPAVFPDGKFTANSREKTISYMQTNYPTISPTQYDEVWKAMQAGEWNYGELVDSGTETSFDRSQGGLLDGSKLKTSPVETDATIGALKGYFPSQLQAIKDAQKAGEWNYSTNKPTGNSLTSFPAPSVAEITTTYAADIKTLSVQYDIKAGSAITDKTEAIATEIKNALETKTWDSYGNTFQSSHTLVNLQYPTPDEATVKTTFANEIKTLSNGYYVQKLEDDKGNAITPKGTLEEDIVSEIKDAVAAGKWDYSTDTFKFGFLTKLVATDRTGIIKDHQDAIDLLWDSATNKLQGVLGAYDADFAPTAAFTMEQKIAMDILQAMKTGQWDVAKNTFATTYTNFQQFKLKTPASTTSPLVIYTRPN